MVRRTAMKNRETFCNQKLKQLNFPLIFETWLTFELIANILSSSCYSINEMKTKGSVKQNQRSEWMTHHITSFFRLTGERCFDVIWKRAWCKFRILKIEFNNNQILFGVHTIASLSNVLKGRIVTKRNTFL